MNLLGRYHGLPVGSCRRQAVWDPDSQVWGRRRWGPAWGRGLAGIPKTWASSYPPNLLIGEPKGHLCFQPHGSGHHGLESMPTAELSLACYPDPAGKARTVDTNNMLSACSVHVLLPSLSAFFLKGPPPHLMAPLLLSPVSFPLIQKCE